MYYILSLHCRFWQVARALAACIVFCSLTLTRPRSANRRLPFDYSLPGAILPLRLPVVRAASVRLCRHGSVAIPSTRRRRPPVRHPRHPVVCTRLYPESVC